MGFKKLFRKSLGFVLKPLEILPESVQNFAYPIAGAALGSTVGMPMLGASIGSAANAYNDTGSLKNAALSAGGTYAGNVVGGAIGNQLGMGTVGSTVFNNAPSNIFSNLPGGAIGSSLANASLGGAIGSSLGGDIAKNYFDQASLGGGFQAFQPRQEKQQDPPASLSGLSGLTGEQQSSNIANQGVYGGGAGPQEQQYFLNLINRRLIDEQNHPADISTLKPIENSYLQNLGLGGYQNSSNLLEAINRWQPQA